MIARRIRAVALAASATLALVLPAAGAAEAPSQGALPHGGSYVLVADNTLGASALDLWFRAPDSGYDNAAPGLARVTAVAAAAAKLESGRSLSEIVRSVGGDLTVQVYPDIIGISVTVPSSAARRVIAAMTAAYFAPKIDQDAFVTGQKDTAVLEAQQGYLSDQQLHNAVFAQLFASGPAHVAPIPSSVVDLTKLTLTQAQAFAKQAFRSTNATLTMVGAIDPSSIEAVTEGSSDGTQSAPILSQVAAAPNPNTTLLVTVHGIGLGWVGPGIQDEKAATAMDFVADYLFREGSGTVAKAVDALSDDSYVSGQFITLHNPGVMLVTIGGSKASAAQETVLDAVKTLEKPLGAAAFEAARTAFLYHLSVDTQTPGGEADNLGWYAVEGNPSYAPGIPDGRYLASARALDPAYVSAIVQQYLSQPVVVRLAPAANNESKESDS